MTANAEPQRRALEEAQARAAALASELAGTRREIETQAAQSQVAVERAANSHFAQATQAVRRKLRTASSRSSQGRAEVAKLMARASALLGQGNIGAARIVLERAAETGSAQASFVLAETYDPAILSAWGTLRNARRGDEGARALREGSCRRHSGGEGSLKRIASVRG